VKDQGRGNQTSETISICDYHNIPAMSVQLSPVHIPVKRFPNCLPEGTHSVRQMENLIGSYRLTIRTGTYSRVVLDPTHHHRGIFGVIFVLIFRRFRTVSPNNGTKEFSTYNLESIRPVETGDSLDLNIPETGLAVCVVGLFS
jgi:hypothetical protein